MIRRFDAPITTHEDYRIRPAEWLLGIAALAVLYLVCVGVMADGLTLLAR
jgi:hypothetical protein